MAAKSTEASENAGWQLLVSGTTYDAALTDVTPYEQRVVGFGRQYVLRTPEKATYEGWLDRMAEVASNVADLDDWQTHEAIVKDMDRAGK